MDSRFIILVFAGTMAARADDFMPSEQVELNRVAIGIVTRLIGSPGDVWEGSGNGGYLLKADVDLTGDGRPEWLVSSTLNMFNHSTDWLVYARSPDRKLIPFDGSFRAPPGYVRPGRNEAGAFVIAGDLGWSEEGLRVTRFERSKIVEELLPHGGEQTEQSARDFELGLSWPRVRYPVFGIRLSDFASGKIVWREIDIDKASPADHSGYFILAEDAAQMLGNTAFTAEFALQLLNSAGETATRTPVTVQSDSGPREGADLLPQERTLPKSSASDQDIVLWPWLAGGAGVFLLACAGAGRHYRDRTRRRRLT